LTGKRRLRVLIAEDDEDVRNVLADLIRSEPSFELVGAAADTVEAIELAAAEQPDVVVLDVSMPGGGGRNAMVGIKRRSPGSKTIVLSADHDRSTVLEMLQAGAVGYLVKGGSIDEIIDAIKGAPEGQASLSIEVTSDVIVELAGQLSVRSKASRRHRSREQRIRRVLHGEDAMAIVFQPIVALRRGKIVGAEALARFAGPPQRRPDAWFAEAEEVGLGGQLELFAARRAVEALQHLPRAVYLTINVSPSTLAKASFHKLVSKIEGERLVAEVTEHAPLPDYDDLARALKRLRALGMRLAIDDVGAGFASLRHILRLAPDLIKLDLTMIRNIHRDHSKQALAAGLISFARKSGATIVAEGIQSATELNALVELGVGYGQGYFLGRPAPLPLPSKPIRRQSP
jgi:EAL domain-containing protein (putative c-di-GMP-specific phosphodiesterase class I)/FixJ family two-component response regulator